MNHRSAMWHCAAAAILILCVRLLGGGIFAPLLITAQTGRIAADAPEETPPPATEATQTTNSTFPTQITQQSEPEDTPDAVLSFSSGAFSLPSIRYNCSYRPDLQALLSQPLQWDLTGSKPTVLIVHTHATESYTGDYTPSDPYRTLDETENMLAIGDEVARVLELGGITVIHDRTLHDYPDYNSAYSNARKTIQSYLKKYPTIQLVLDLHRDAISTTSGQYATAATVGGQQSAQLMVVVGTDASGLRHPNWQENLSLALKLTALLEQENPGITRPISLRSQRFNMDLSPGSLLVEVGAAGNTRQEALLAANALAHAILQLSHGSE